MLQFDLSQLLWHVILPHFGALGEPYYKLSWTVLGSDDSLWQDRINMHSSPQVCKRTFREHCFGEFEFEQEARYSIIENHFGLPNPRTQHCAYFGSPRQLLRTADTPLQIITTTYIYKKTISPTSFRYSTELLNTRRESIMRSINTPNNSASCVTSEEVWQALPVLLLHHPGISPNTMK